MSSFIRNCLSVSGFVAIGSFGAVAGAQEQIGAQTTPGSPVSVFGNRGQIAISSEAGATFEHTSVSGVDDSTTHLVLRPGVDYFLIKRLSLGAFVGIDPGVSISVEGRIGVHEGQRVIFNPRYQLLA